MAMKYVSYVSHNIYIFSPTRQVTKTLQIEPNMVLESKGLLTPGLTYCSFFVPAYMSSSCPDDRRKGSTPTQLPVNLAS